MLAHFDSKMKEMSIQDFSKTYHMINPSERNEIIKGINNGFIKSNTSTGTKWWKSKHNPANEIPKNIYLLGKGTILELHVEYIKTYGNIEWRHFTDYTRELIKQKIMI